MATGIHFTIKNYAKNIVVELRKGNFVRRAIIQPGFSQIITPGSNPSNNIITPGGDPPNGHSIAPGLPVLDPTHRIGSWVLIPAGRYEVKVWDEQDPMREILFYDSVNVIANELASLPMDLASPNSTLPGKVTFDLKLTYMAEDTLVTVPYALVAITSTEAATLTYSIDGKTTIDLLPGQYEVTINPPPGSSYEGRSLKFIESLASINVSSTTPQTVTAKLTLGPVVVNPIATGLKIQLKHRSNVYNGLDKATLNESANVTIQSLNVVPAFSTTMVVEPVGLSDFRRRIGPGFGLPGSSESTINVPPGRYQVTVTPTTFTSICYFDPKVSTVTVLPNEFTTVIANLRSSSNTPYNPAITGVNLDIRNFSCDNDAQAGIFLKFQKIPLGSAADTIISNAISDQTIRLLPGEYNILGIYRTKKINASVKILPNKILRVTLTLPTIICR